MHCQIFRHTDKFSQELIRMGVIYKLAYNLKM